jgi:hypothetical protein
VRALEIEHNVQFANVLEVFVQSFYLQEVHVIINNVHICGLNRSGACVKKTGYQAMNELQDGQFVAVVVYSQNEKERCISSKDALVGAVLQKRTLVLGARKALANNLTL